MTKVKVIKTEPQILRFKSVKTTYAALKEPQLGLGKEHLKGDAAYKQYTVTVALEKKSDDYNTFINAVKKATQGLSEKEVKDMLVGRMGKLTPVSEADIERHEGLTENFVKVTFKTGEKYPPVLYDWTEEKSRTSTKDVFIGGGDTIMLEGRVRLGKHPTGFYLGTNVLRVAKLEGGSDYSNPDAWFDFACVDEQKDEFLEEVDAFNDTPKGETKEDNLDIEEISLDELE